MGLFRRARPDTEPAGPVEPSGSAPGGDGIPTGDGPVAGDDRGAPAAWETVGGLTTTLTPPTPTFKIGEAVKPDLVALASPRLSTGMGHLVSGDGPPGVVSGLATVGVQRRADAPASDPAGPGAGSPPAPDGAGSPGSSPADADTARSPAAADLPVVTGWSPPLAAGPGAGAGADDGLLRPVDAPPVESPTRNLPLVLAPVQRRSDGDGTGASGIGGSNGDRGGPWAWPGDGDGGGSADLGAATSSAPDRTDHAREAGAPSGTEGGGTAAAAAGAGLGVGDPPAGHDAAESAAPGTSESTPPGGSDAALPTVSRQVDLHRLVEPGTRPRTGGLGPPIELRGAGDGAGTVQRSIEPAVASPGLPAPALPPSRPGTELPIVQRTRATRPLPDSAGLGGAGLGARGTDPAAWQALPSQQPDAAPGAGEALPLVQRTSEGEAAAAAATAPEPAPVVGAAGTAAADASGLGADSTAAIPSPADEGTVAASPEPPGTHSTAVDTPAPLPVDDGDGAGTRPTLGADHDTGIRPTVGDGHLGSLDHEVGTASDAVDVSDSGAGLPAPAMPVSALQRQADTGGPDAGLLRPGDEAGLPGTGPAPGADVSVQAMQLGAPPAAAGPGSTADRAPAAPASTDPAPSTGPVGSPATRPDTAGPAGAHGLGGAAPVLQRLGTAPAVAMPLAVQRSLNPALSAATASRTRPEGAGGADVVPRPTWSTESRPTAPPPTVQRWPSLDSLRDAGRGALGAGRDAVTGATGAGRDALAGVTGTARDTLAGATGAGHQALADAAATGSDALTLATGAARDTLTTAADAGRDAVGAALASGRETVGGILERAGGEAAGWAGRGRDAAAGALAGLPEGVGPLPLPGGIQAPDLGALPALDLPDVPGLPDLPAAGALPLAMPRAATGALGALRGGAAGTLTSLGTGAAGTLSALRGDAAGALTSLGNGAGGALATLQDGAGALAGGLPGSGDLQNAAAGVASASGAPQAEFTFPQPPAPESAGAGGAGGTAGGGGAGAASGADLDELAHKLYDRIRWRLRSELRLDRERAGLGAGVRR